MQLCHLGGKDLTEKVTLEKKLEVGRIETCGYLGKGRSGFRNSKYKGPEVEQCLEHSRNRKETRAEWEGVVGKEVRKITGGRRNKGASSWRDLQAVIRILVFTGSL